MRRTPPHAYFLLIFSLLSLMSLSKESTENLRGTAVAVFAPAWHSLIASKSYFSLPQSSEEDAALSESSEEIQRLRIENILLHNEITHLKDVMQQELKIISQLAASKENQIPKGVDSLLKQRHRLELQKLRQLHLEAVPAKVIYRSASTWNSSLWINVGESTNESVGRSIIAKNSPVVVGSAIVGVVDYVGKNQARVRLITDSGLTPSVRALRGAGPRNQLLTDKIDALMQMIEKTKSILPEGQESEDLTTALTKFRERLFTEGPVWFLAKGELQGASTPLWRTNGHLLKGVGFNYDFADDKGPARDLRTGRPLDKSDIPSMPILKARDLLVTTGMDGVFPPGLLVAEVKSVQLLKEGDYAFELEAVPVIDNLDDLSLVFVIPPTGYDFNEQPPPIGW